MFRLRKMLEWKCALEREARAERIEAESRAGALERAIQRVREMRDELPSGSLDGEDSVLELAEWARYADGLRERERRARARLDRFRPTLSEKVRRHVDLRREVKGLTRLEERDRSTRRRHAERKEQEAIDDAASRTKLPGPGTDFPPDEPASAEPVRSDSTESRREGDFHRNRGTRT